MIDSLLNRLPGPGSHCSPGAGQEQEWGEERAEAATQGQEKGTRGESRVV